MHVHDLAQFKFSSGQEIVCEVMEWPTDGEKDIIVRNAMAIVMGETSDGERVYVFKPWVHFFAKNDETTVKQTTEKFKCDGTAVEQRTSIGQQWNGRQTNDDPFFNYDGTAVKQTAHSCLTMQVRRSSSRQWFVFVVNFS